MVDTNETTSSDLETKIYEVSFHAPVAVGEDGAAAVFERVKGLIASLNGSLIAEGAPKRMPLATEIVRSVTGKREHHTEGYFSWIKYEAPAESAPALEIALKKDREVLRYLLIVTVRDSGPAARFLSSDRLEGETIRKREPVEASKGPVSEEELDKSIEQLVGEKA
jgi:ribosomal protein S6